MLKYDLDKMLYVIPADKHSPEEVSGILKEHPEYNIATVAEMCGVSVSSFNRTFKGKYKMTPNDYKRIK